MRLIDADELDAILTSIVSGQDTVEAIPIKWLLNLRSRYLEAECPMSVCVVNEILNLWAKENEID